MGTRSEQRSADWMDRLGSLASAACVVHCVALAAVPTLLPAAGVVAAVGHAHEGFLMGASVVLALPALALGFQAHRSPLVVGTFATGLVLLVASQLAHDHGGPMGLALAVAGGLTLVGAHLANLRQRHVHGPTCAA
ncbi:MAG: MerC domain-containing protein [Myxococcales bacterium]|nr:MerC domain-containing protein [Myxococcales bacterium]